MIQEWTVEVAKPEDASDLAALQIASLEASHRDFLPQDAQTLVLGSSSIESRTEGWSGWLARSRTETLVVRDESGLVGFVALHPRPDGDGTAAEIAAIFVRENAWRSGVGQALMQAALSEVRNQDYEKVVVWVLETNTPARSFYEAQGFSVDGRSRVFHEGSETLHELEMVYGDRRAGADEQEPPPIERRGG